MFAKDGDLLVREPRLFHDVAWSGQRVLERTGVTYNASVGLLGAVGDGLVAAGVRVGSVVLIEGVAGVVTSELGDDVVLVSRAGSGSAEDLMPLDVEGSSVGVRVHTFAPQIGVVHEQLLRSLGLERGATQEGGPIAEDRVTNSEELVEVEALGALHLVLASAAAMVGGASPEWAKAQLYGDRFRDARRRVSAEVDLDGDGVADAVRRMSIVQLVRA